MGKRCIHYASQDGPIHIESGSGFINPQALQKRGFFVANRKKLSGDGVFLVCQNVTLSVTDVIFDNNETGFSSRSRCFYVIRFERSKIF